MVQSHYDVLVIGGGPSGLLTTFLLDGFSVLLVEAAPHFGGNAWTSSWKGNRYPTAAQLISPADPAILALCAGLSLPSPYLLGADKLLTSSGIGSLTRTHFALGGLSTKRKLAGLTLADLLSQPDVPKAARTFWRAYALSNWGGLPEETSAAVAVDAAEWRTLPKATFNGGLGDISSALVKQLRSRDSVALRPRTIAVGVKRSRFGWTIELRRGGRLERVTGKTLVMAVPRFEGTRLLGVKDARAEPNYTENYATVTVFHAGAPPLPPADYWLLDSLVTDVIVPPYFPRTNQLGRMTAFVPRSPFPITTVRGRRDLAATVKETVRAVGLLSAAEMLHLKVHGTHPMRIPGPERMQPVPALPDVHWVHGDVTDRPSSFSGALRQAATLAQRLGFERKLRRQP